MKSLKFLKAMALIMTIFMVTSIVSVFAEVTIDPPTQGLADTKITVTGNAEGLEEGDTITVMICFPGVTASDVDDATIAGESLDNLVAGAKNAEVDEEGNFTVEIFIPTDAQSDENYNLVIKSPAEDDEKEVSIEFTNPGDKLEGVVELNDADNVGDVKDAILAYAETMGVDMVLLGLADIDAVAQDVYDVFDNEKLDENESSIAIAVLIIENAALVQAYNGGAIESIDTYINYLRVGDEDDIELFDSVYEDYQTKVKATGMASILANMSNQNFNVIEDVRDKFEEQTVIQGICYPERLPADTLYFIKHEVAQPHLDLSRFNKLTNSQQLEIARKVSIAKPDDWDAIQAEIDDAINKLEDDDDNSGNPPSGGGTPGGSRPGGGSVIIYEPEPTPAGFSDMGGYEWAVPAISYLVEKGAVAGYPGNVFMPYNSITREEFVKIIVAAFYGVNNSATSTFTDMNENDWFYRYVATAVEKNITKGIGDGKFGVGLNITRQDMAVLLYNIAVDLGATVDTTPVAFADDGNIADYARDAVYALRNMGVVQGMGNNDFAPANTATRAEASQMIYGIMKALGR